MQKFPRRKLIIINVKKFKRSSRFHAHPRKGTDRDASRLQELFLDLGFFVERHDDPRASEIKEVLYVAANKDFSNFGCFVCAFLSHGEEGVIYGTDGFVNIKDLASLLCTKELAGKPKIFFFQACRGADFMESYNSVDIPRAKANKLVLDLPMEYDFLFCYSTAEGYYAWRHEEKGSWFIRILVNVFRRFAHKMDIIRLMTLVNYVITAATRGKRQIGSSISQLRKELFFFPPYRPLWLNNLV